MFNLFDLQSFTRFDSFSQTLKYWFSIIFVGNSSRSANMSVSVNMSMSMSTRTRTHSMET